MIARWLTPQELHPPKWSIRANRRRFRVALPPPTRQEGPLCYYPRPWTHWVCNRCACLIEPSVPEWNPCHCCGDRNQRARVEVLGQAL